MISGLHDLPNFALNALPVPQHRAMVAGGNRKRATRKADVVTIT